MRAAAHLAQAIARVAAEYCDGRVAYVLEGGYDVEAIASSVALIAQTCDEGKPRNSESASAQAIPQAQRALLQQPFFTG